MSKMAELAAEVEDMFFHEEMSYAAIQHRTGLPYADIKAYIVQVSQNPVSFETAAEADHAGWASVLASTLDRAASRDRENF
jgi:hypothetical protein